MIAAGTERKTRTTAEIAAELREREREKKIQEHVLLDSVKQDKVRVVELYFSTHVPC